MAPRLATRTDPGQERRSWRGLVGGVALVAGVALAANALAYYLFRGMNAPGAMTVAGVGGGLVVVALLLLLPAWLGALRGPRVRPTLRAVAAALVGLAAFAGLSALNTRHFWRVHLAAEADRLHPRTLKVLEQVDRPLRIINTLVESPSPLEQMNNRIRRRASALLGEYAKQCPRARLLSLDPSREAQLREEVRRELGLRTPLRRDAVLFALGDATKRVGLDQLLAPADAPGAPPRFQGESVFTAAVLALLEGRPTRVGFVRGHGEKLLDDYEPGGPGLSELAALLAADNCRVRPVELPIIPEDCDVLVVPGPTTLLPLRHLVAIRNFARQEGKGLVLLLDPVGEDPRGSGLEDLLHEVGIVAETRQTILHVARTLSGPRLSATVITTHYPSHSTGANSLPRPHPIVEGVRQFHTVFHVACVVRVRRALVPGAAAREPRAGPGTVEFVRTSSKAFARRGVAPDELERIRFQGAAERRGPFGLGVACGSWGEDAGARLVVFGDSDFATNAFLARGGNAMLFRNAVAWAARKVYKTAIPPRALHQEPPFDPTPREEALARWAIVFAPPFHVVLLGLVVWWLRRR